MPPPTAPEKQSLKTLLIEVSLLLGLCTNTNTNECARRGKNIYLNYTTVKHVIYYAHWYDIDNQDYKNKNDSFCKHQKGIHI